MKRAKPAFTLIEILVATALLSLVLLGLYGALDTQRRSVGVIKENLERSINQDRAIMTLYSDILQSDGNLTIKKGERDSICIENTTNSIYGLDIAKVCWLVLKDKDSLIRVEGGEYSLPLKLDDNVEADIVARGITLFDIYREKKSGNILVVLQEMKKEPFSFLLQGIKEPPKIVKRPKKKKPKKGRPKKGKSKNGNTNKTPPKRPIPPNNEDILKG